LKLFRAC